MRTGGEEKLQGRRKIYGVKKNYRGEEKITVVKKILLKVYQLSRFLDFNTGVMLLIKVFNTIVLL